MSSLDLTINTQLYFLDCSGNLINKLNFNNNKGLTYLYCGGNLLTRLNVSINSSLQQLDLSNLPALYKVCIWISPFPSAGLWVTTSGSPNAYFSTDCNL